MSDHHAPSSSQHQVYHTGTHETNGVSDGDGPDLTCGWIPGENRTKWTYFLLGCAILLPWNALVNGTSFFLSRLVGSPFYPTFSSYMSSVYMLTKLASQFYSTVTSKQSSPSRRISVSISAMILVLISLWLSTYIRVAPSTFFAFTLLNATALAVSTGYLCTATYARAALLGTPILQNALAGQAASAVASSAVQVISSIISLWVSSPGLGSMEVRRANASNDQPEEVAARIFFLVSAMFMGIALVAYMLLMGQSRFKSVTRTLEQHRRVGDADELTRLVADDYSIPDPKSRIYQICVQNFIFMFSIAYVYTITLSVFPAITARVQSVNPGFHPLLFTAVHVLAVNTGDLAGRCTCSFRCLLGLSAKTILAMSLLRTLFIPLVLASNIYRPSTTTVAPLIQSDILFMAIMLAMGYTNGFVACLATLVVSSSEHNPRLKGRREDVDITAALSGSFTIAGLTAGALSSFGVQAMI